MESCPRLLGKVEQPASYALPTLAGGSGGKSIESGKPLFPNLLKTYRGEVPEWSNGAVSKTVVLAIVPRVRIPASPPPAPAITVLSLLPCIPLYIPAA